jgi:hypothetical protein
MAFSRKFLLDNGVPEDKVDVILAERNRTLKDYVPQSDVQAQIDAAVEAAKKEVPSPDVKTTAEYLALMGENAKLKAFQGDDFASVKAPYRDIVWEKLDHAEKHKPYTEQLQELQGSMPDLFTVKEEPPKPSFGAQPQGSVPSGKAGASFMDSWGFVPQKG